MTDSSGWYPPSQILTLPELPTYLKNVCDLKPIVGVPSDTDVIGIHTVMESANRVAGVPGMYDPGLLMGLASHLFGAQMAKYRSKYSLIIFSSWNLIDVSIMTPQDATYSPPELPAHISVKLEPVLGAPTDEEIIRVQEALAPSMFDAHVNLELSQHLFDLHMGKSNYIRYTVCAWGNDNPIARYMRLSGETLPSPTSRATARVEGPIRAVDQTPSANDRAIDAMNNIGTGANAAVIHHEPPSAPSIDIGELMERSNQQAERFNQLLGSSNELIERCGQPVHDNNSPTLADRFNQVLERLTQLVEQSHQPAERSDRLTERFNRLFERFNELTEQSNQPAQRANELAERSNEMADKANQLAEQLDQRFRRSNELAEQANKALEKLGDLQGNINRVLVRIQHAIVRNHKGNTLAALDCLINENGETPSQSAATLYAPFKLITKHAPNATKPINVIISGTPQELRVPDEWLGKFLRFYGIAKELYEDDADTSLKAGVEQVARLGLRRYLSSCLG